MSLFEPEEVKPKRSFFRWGCASTVSSIILAAVMVFIFLNRVQPSLFNNSTGGDISYGSSVTDAIGGGQRDLWTFRGQRGDVVSISMDGSFDTYISLEDSDGRELAYNDDYNDTRHSYIAPFELPYDGTYTIIARGWSSSGSGQYTLRLDYSEVMPTAVPPTSTMVPSRRSSLEYGETVTGNVTNEAGDSWTFRGDEGDIITIDMEGNFDTYLLLFDSDNRQLTYDDDSGDDTNSRIIYYELPYDGTYIIVARGWAGRTGSYSLTLHNAEDMPSPTPAPPPTSTPLPRRAGSIEYGQTVNGRVRDFGGDAWTFQGEAGDNVTINMEGDFDTYLVLTDSDYRQLTYDDDSGDDLNSRIISFNLPRDGTYIIVARGYNGRTGGYSLTLEFDN